MVFPPPIGRVGLLGADVIGKRQMAARATCNLQTGDLYTYPLSTDTINGTQPLTFKWNTDCGMATDIDLSLYYPGKGIVQGWSGVAYSKGEYQVTLNPSWWNNTASAQMQLVILETGAPTWDTKSPPGPVFKVSYNAAYTTTTVNGQVTTSAKGPTVTDGGNAIIQNVSDTNSSKGISKGAIAAAVIVPLLVIAILAVVAIRFWRAREAEKRKRWSAAVSQHSALEWEKGAQPGEKPASILGRPSTHYSFRPGSMATSSVYAVENNMAGAGASGNFARPSFQLRSYSAENVNSSRSSVVLPDGQVRQSRISFAETARPDRRSRLSLGDGLRPVIGRLPGGSRSANDLSTPAKKAAYATGSAIADDEDDINISPSQLQGPHSFADAEMRRVGQGKRTGRRSIMSLGGSRRNSTTSVVSADDFKTAASARGSVDELRDMEAVMLMRRSMISQHSKGSPNPEAQFEHDDVEALDNNVVVHDMPSVPAPAAAGTSTVAYGPDQMLAVYAARGKVSATAMPPLPTPGMRPIGAPAPGDMRSYVHLNTGTVSSAAIGALPPPGPPTPNGSSLAVPTLNSQGRTAVRMSGASETSQYSEDAEVGEAK